MGSLPHHIENTKTHLTTFSVAIIGGGIGGLALAHGLNKYPNIDYHVYEAAPAFSEIGAGVSFGVNALRALDMIGPTAKEAFQKHATSNLWPSHANIWCDYTVVRTSNSLRRSIVHKDFADPKTCSRAKDQTRARSLHAKRAPQASNPFTARSSSTSL